MDASFSLPLHSTNITLNERFSHLETTSRQVDQELMQIRDVSCAAQRFEASKNWRLALQMANRMPFCDDSLAATGTVFDSVLPEMASCQTSKSVTQHINHTPAGRLTGKRPSAKLRLTLSPASAGRQHASLGFANAQHASPCDEGVSGCWIGSQKKNRRKGVLIAQGSSLDFSSLETVPWFVATNGGGPVAVRKPTTSSNTQAAVVKTKTAASRRKRRKAKALGVPNRATESLGVGTAIQLTRKASSKRSARRRRGGRASSSSTRGPSNGIVIAKVTANKETLDRELDAYMSHAKVAFA